MTRKALRRRRLDLLTLECRALPSSTLYLDFGDNFLPADWTRRSGSFDRISRSAVCRAPIFARAQPMWTRRRCVSSRRRSAVTFDYNGSGTVNSADWTDLRQRAQYLFNATTLLLMSTWSWRGIDDTSSATYIDGVRNTLMAGPAVDGERNAWAISSVYAPRVANGASVGSNFGIYGIASGRDISGNNANDDSCLICCDIVFSNSAALSGRHCIRLYNVARARSQFWLGSHVERRSREFRHHRQ